MQKKEACLPYGNDWLLLAALEHERYRKFYRRVMEIEPTKYNHNRKRKNNMFEARKTKTSEPFPEINFNLTDVEMYLTNWR